MYEPPAEWTLPTHIKLVELLQLDVPHATLARAVLAVMAVLQKCSPVVVTV